MINPNELRLKKNAYIRIDTLPPEEINPALKELCGQWGIQAVFLPMFGNPVDVVGTRQAIASYLLKSD